MLVILYVAVSLVGIAFCFRVCTAWGNCWGASPAEGDARMTGDAYLEGGPPNRVMMTRAVSISQPPEVVWPWLAQLGRGAGWYSYDFLDNGGKTSARHIVSWVPQPQLGDASPIGYLRHLDPGREIVWWAGGVKFLGAMARMVVDIGVRPEGKSSRLVIRIAGDAAGPPAPLVLGIFQVIDTIMARRQLLGIKERVERYGCRTEDGDHPENGAREQYQFYEVIYASGERAGVRGKEGAAYWRQKAREDKVLV